MFPTHTQNRSSTQDQKYRLISDRLFGALTAVIYVYAPITKILETEGKTANNLLAVSRPVLVQCHIFLASGNYSPNFSSQGIEKCYWYSFLSCSKSVLLTIKLGNPLTRYFWFQTKLHMSNWIQTIGTSLLRTLTIRVRLNRTWSVSIRKPLACVHNVTLVSLNC